MYETSFFCFVLLSDHALFLFSPDFRACRLKKKAQHEANKIKLWGLNQEYGERAHANRTPTTQIPINTDTVCEMKPQV